MDSEVMGGQTLLWYSDGDDDGDEIEIELPRNSPVLPVFAIAGVIVSIIFVSCKMYLNYKSKRGCFSDGTAEDNRHGNAAGTLEINSGGPDDFVDNGNTELTNKERMVLYSEAFGRNKHQSVLEASRILVSTDDDDDDDDNGDDDNGDELLDVEGGTENSNNLLHRENIGDCFVLEDTKSTRRCQPISSSCNSTANNRDVEEVTTNYPQQQHKKKKKITLIHPRTHIFDDVGNCQAAATLAHQNCAICLEPMHAGETVVWSETKSCPHVYHKVSYSRFCSI